MNQPPRRSSSSGLFLLALIPILGVSFFIWKLVKSGPAEPVADPSAFNLNQVPETAPKKTADYTSRFEAEMDARKTATQSGLGGFITETDTMYRPSAGEKTGRMAEKEFIEKYDPAIKRQQEYMAAIGRKYYKKSALARQVDAEFAKMPRYMEIKARYEKDRDAYQWARDTIKLPEVRKAIFKYAAKPEAWQLAVQMSMEALKKPPPKPVHDEMMRFMTQDKEMKSWVSDFTKKVIPGLGTMMTTAAPPGTDLSQLSRLGSAISGMKDPLEKKGSGTRTRSAAPKRKR